jgi:hypothetical protein
LCGAGTSTLWKADHKYVESLEMRCWRRMEKISWIEGVRNEVVLHTVNEDRNILNGIKRKKAS